MRVFRFEALDNAGLEISESIEASDQEEAIRRIRERGYFVTRIKEVNSADDPIPRWGFGHLRK